MDALVEGAGQCVSAIEYMANRSKNLKGNFVRDLKNAAKALRILVSTAFARTRMAEQDPSTVDSEFAKMREELRVLRAEVSLLRMEKREQQEGAAAESVGSLSSLTPTPAPRGMPLPLPLGRGEGGYFGSAPPLHRARHG